MAGFETRQNVDETLKGAQLCFIFTDWPQVKEYPLDGFKKNMEKAIVLDGRNCYALEEAEKAGIVYSSVGRREIV